MEKEPVIEIRNLVKDYGHGRGVFGVSFTVYKGECFGFLGPNGAGKSTTIRHLMGFSRPKSGETLICGLNSMKYRTEVLQSVGYLPGEVALPLNLTGKDVYKIQLSLKNVKDTSFAEYLIKYFEVDLNLLCKNMSLGMKRKMAILCAFLNDPDILVLDEPSSGLDPEMQIKFINFILEEKKRGKTILLSSHIFSEVDETCDRISIIKDGEIVSTFIANDLKQNKNKKYEIHFDSDDDYLTFISRLGYDINLVSTTRKERKIVVSANDDDISDLLFALKGLNVIDFNEIKVTLEEYFMSFYKEDRVYKGVK